MCPLVAVTASEVYKQKNTNKIFVAVLFYFRVNKFVRIM